MQLKNTLNGILWSIISVIFSRLGSLAAQLIAGWLLLPQDFGKYAAAFAISAILMSIKNGGLLSFLLHKKEQERLNYKFFANITNYTSASVLIIIGLFIDDTTKSILIFIFAINIAFSIFSLELRLDMSIRQEFQKLSAHEISCSAIQYCSTIILLISGLGIYSLAIPYIIVIFYEAIKWKLKYEKSLFTSLKLRVPYKNLVTYVIDIKWPLLSSLVVGLSLNGDYLALSMTTTPYNLGLYFFAFQLTTAASQLLTTAVRSVIIPSLVALKNDEKSFWFSFEQYSILLYVFGFIIFSVGISFIDFAISFIWDDKWLKSIFIIKVLLISLVLRLQVALIYTVFESLQLWKVKFTAVALDSIALFLTVLVVGSTNDIRLISIAVASYRVLFTFVLTALSSKYYNIKFEESYLKTMYFTTAWIVIIFYITNSEDILFDFKFGASNLSGSFLNFLTVIVITGVLVLCLSRDKSTKFIKFLSDNYGKRNK